MTPTKEIAAKVLTTVDAGLCTGVGSPIPGEMCIEAAVCFAFGLPHGDNPPCVGSAVRSFKIRLNDSAWSSNEARAKGMRKLAIAQLGSEQIDQKIFAQKLALKVCQKIVPMALRTAAGKANEPHKTRLEESAVKCESATSIAEAEQICRVANKVARAAAAYAAAYADAADAAYAAYAAAAYAAAYADAAADAAYAADAAADAAYAADAADAADAAYAAADARDKFLTIAADLCLEVLVEMKSPGCEWLDLCEA